jgi:hypothetical protein
LIAFFSSSHVNFIGSTVYTLRIYVKKCSVFVHLPKDDGEPASIHRP